MINFDDFLKIEMRVGTIIKAEPFPEAHKPAFKLQIDFGESLGIKKTSAQLTKLYEIDALIGHQVIAVVNFPPKQIANFMSEVLVLGAVGKDDEVVLLKPDRVIDNGQHIA